MARAVDRTLAIIEFLSAEEDPIGVRELAGRLKMPPAAVQRAIAVLQRRGFVHRHELSGKYYLGMKIVQLGERVLGRTHLPTVARPILRWIRNGCDETVSLFVIEGRERACIASEQSTQGVRRVMTVGTLLPLWAGSSGKLLLAYLPDDIQTAILDSLEIRPLTQNTRVDRESLRREFQRIRSQGYALSRGERIPEAASVSTPVWDARGVVVAALCVCAPSMRWSEAREPLLIGLACEGAARLSKELGFRAIEHLDEPAAAPEAASAVRNPAELASEVAS